jgi:hypothetical protein
MRLRSVTKKLLKLKKGGEEKLKRATKQKPNRPSRKVSPVETGFTFGDVHKPTSEQTIYGLHNNKIVPIEHNKLESDSANFESVPTTELQKKLRTKTEKAALMKSLKFTRKSRPPSSRSSDGSQGSVPDIISGIKFKNLKKLKHKPRKSPSSHSSHSSSSPWYNKPYMN